MARDLGLNTHHTEPKGTMMNIQRNAVALAVNFSELVDREMGAHHDIELIEAEVEAAAGLAARVFQSALESVGFTFAPGFEDRLRTLAAETYGDGAFRKEQPAA